MDKTLTLNKLLEKFHNIKNAEGQKLKVDQYLERSMIVFQGIEKIHVSYHKLYYLYTWKLLWFSRILRKLPLQKKSLKSLLRRCCESHICLCIWLQLPAE